MDLAVCQERGPIYNSEQAVGGDELLLFDDIEHIIQLRSVSFRKDTFVLNNQRVPL